MMIPKLLCLHRQKSDNNSCLCAFISELATVQGCFLSCTGLNSRVFLLFPHIFSSFSGHASSRSDIKMQRCNRAVVPIYFQTPPHCTIRKKKHPMFFLCHGKTKLQICHRSIFAHSPPPSRARKISNWRNYSQVSAFIVQSLNDIHESCSVRKIIIKNTYSSNATIFSTLGK